MMPWVKLDDQFADHPKIVACGPLASWLYVCGLGYCSRLLTDGFIPDGQIRKLADLDDAKGLAERLVEVNLWERCEGGYRVHDYHNYQPTREKALATREARAEAGSRGGKQKASNLLDASQGVARPVAKQNSTPYPSRTRTPSPTTSDHNSEPSVGVVGPPPARLPTPAPKRADARPTLPSAEQLVDDLREWADEKGVRDILADEVDRFRDYCLSGKNGKPVTYADYAAGCRKWITNPNYGHGARAPALTGPNGSHTPTQPKRTANNIEVLRRAF